MKIALLTDSYYPQVNGVVVFLSALAKQLSRRHRVVLFAPGKKKFRKQKVSKNFSIWWVPASPFPFYKGYRMTHPHYRRLHSILEKEKPDIIHVHAPVLLGLMGLYAAKKLSIPSIATYHTHFPDYLPHLFGGSLLPFLEKLSQYPVKKLVKYFLSKASCSTAPTQQMVRELRSYGLRNVVYLPDGIELERKKPRKIVTDEFRRRHKISSIRKVVLYVGRISFEKRLDLLLRAFSRIENNRRLLLVVGGGPYLHHLKRLASRLGVKNVRFTGFISREFLPAAYAVATVFASPSDTETFGLTFLEAMNSSLPCVGVRSLGAKELIKHGESGLVVKPGSATAFAKAVERLLKNATLRKRMGRKGKEISMRYDIRAVAKQAEELYLKTIRSRGKKA